ncbi:hypothetical protein T01_3898 [Trichinella spiralis]|uniref:Uncharacterized protein n=1 Tax=Trichinella spiralis TaxID=6334 RepID=A0A0V1BVC0_TRISP|nr:hypothetical protein T01_3898 [Trichinella spiralis]
MVSRPTRNRRESGRNPARPRAVPPANTSSRCLIAERLDTVEIARGSPSGPSALSGRRQGDHSRKFLDILPNHQRRSEPFALLALAGKPHGGGDTMFDRFSLRHSPALPNHSSGSPGKWKHTAPFGLDLGPNDAPPPLTVFVLTQSC